MKRITLFALLILICQFIFAQKYELNMNAKVLKNYGGLESGSTITITSMRHTIIPPLVNEFKNPVNEAKDVYTILVGNKTINVKDKLEKILEIEYTDVQTFWNAQILFNVLEQLSKKGTQVALRTEMESDALEYISNIQRYGLAFDDPFLESYIYSIISRIAPTSLIDGRPGNVNLLIQSNPIPNAYMFPNGTLVITTSLISLLHSEDELAAILSHEIAHFVLDHGVQNYNKALDRQKRAEFWAGFATVLTAAAEGYAAANNPYYKPGAATLTVAIASSHFAARVCERLGMKYTSEQEDEADKVAVEMMRILKYDPNALSTALSRIEESLLKERSVDMYYASDHPALIDRIKKAGIPSKNTDKQFEKIISFAVSDAALMKMQDRRFRQALPLVSQNIENNVATADDYIQKANCLLYLKNDVASYKEVEGLIEEANKIDSQNINIIKTSIVVCLRQNDYAKAKKLIESYKNKIYTLLESKNNMPATEWTKLYVFANKELVWLNDMTQKLKAF